MAASRYWVADFASAREAAAEALGELRVGADDEETGALYHFTLGQAFEGKGLTANSSRKNWACWRCMPHGLPGPRWRFTGDSDTRGMGGKNPRCAHATQPRWVAEVIERCIVS